MIGEFGENNGNLVFMGRIFILITNYDAWDINTSGEPRSLCSCFVDECEKGNPSPVRPFPKYHNNDTDKKGKKSDIKTVNGPVNSVKVDEEITFKTTLSYVDGICERK